MVLCDDTIYMGRKICIVKNKYFQVHSLAFCLIFNLAEGDWNVKVSSSLEVYVTLQKYSSPLFSSFTCSSPRLSSEVPASNVLLSKLHDCEKKINFYRINYKLLIRRGYGSVLNCSSLN